MNADKKHLMLGTAQTLVKRGGQLALSTLNSKLGRGSTLTENQGTVATRLEDKIEFVTDGIVSKTLAEGDFGEVEIFCISAGQALSEHTASRNAAIHFIQGKGRIKLGAEWHDALPGTWVFMPANLPHALESQEGLVLVLTLFGSGE